jgi:hypothetical protein
MDPSSSARHAHAQQACRSRGAASCQLHPSHSCSQAAAQPHTSAQHPIKHTEWGRQAALGAYTAGGALYQRPQGAVSSPWEGPPCAARRRQRLPISSTAPMLRRRRVRRLHVIGRTQALTGEVASLPWALMWRSGQPVQSNSGPLLS